MKACDICQRAKSSPENNRLEQMKRMKSLQSTSRILTDQDKCFEAQLFKELLALLDVAKSRTTPYHPQADGLTERFNRTLECILRCFIEENLPDWDEYLDQLAIAYNTAVHATTRLTPFEMVYGRKQRLPVDLILPTQVKFQVERKKREP